MQSITWKCPSNIALVKYWGKKGLQLPANPSLSLALSHCHTITTLSFTAKENDGTLLVSFAFDGEPKPEFEPKLEQYFNRVEHLFPFLTGYQIDINTTNTFPHSSGIASSASGFGALSLCICSMEQAIGETLSEADFFNKASNAARLGSGSASRSVVGPVSLWGNSPIYPGSSDEFSIPVTAVHEVFKTYCDSILIVEEGEKSVSSTAGHSLIDEHPFREARYAEAVKNLSDLKSALESGNLDLFNRVVESEAMMLHALMMSSKPPYILMKPGSLAIVQRVWELREKANLNISVTLDAGANVHLLYPSSQKSKVIAFINDELLKHCKNAHVIHDHVGSGPEKLS